MSARNAITKSTAAENATGIIGHAAADEAVDNGDAGQPAAFQQNAAAGRRRIFCRGDGKTVQVQLHIVRVDRDGVAGADGEVSGQIIRAG